MGVLGLSRNRRLQHVRVLTVALGALLLLIPLVPTSQAATTASKLDPSDVVIALDFSISIMEEKDTRNDFAAALDRIADDVDANREELMSGNATFTFVAFASEAVNYSFDCSKIAVYESERNVSQLADCFRQVADEYRRGKSAEIVRQVGIHTNYVDVFRLADKDLPDDAGRPAVVFFTDGRHDMPGVPPRKVMPAARDAFGDRESFAFLPVGMGLDRKDRVALEAGLRRLWGLSTEVLPCEGQPAFDWPEVVFSSPAEAGVAVSSALRSVTCTFPSSEQTPTPSPTSPPTPTPAVAPGEPGAPRVESQDGGISVSWERPAIQGSAAIIRYEVRCRPENGEWLQTQVTKPPATTISYANLPNGTLFECQVWAVSAAGNGEPATATGMPAGAPGAPLGVAANGADQGANVVVDPGPDGGSAITGYDFECAKAGTDGWQSVPASPDPGTASAGYRISGLTNETDYTCRSYAENELGVSPASAPSNQFLACNGLFQCNAWLLWLLWLLAALLLLFLLLWLISSWMNRTRRYIGAQVDGFPDIELGMGPEVGLMFNRDRRGRVVEALPTSVDPDIRVKYNGGGSFTVTGSGERVPFRAGEPGSVVDANGDAHQLILRAASRPQSDGAVYE